MYNLINRVSTPTRLSNLSGSLIDVMITDVFNQDIMTLNFDLGLSDHMAQILFQRIDEPLINVICKEKRYFSQEKMNEFNNILKGELWGVVYTSDDVNISFKAFYATLWYYFNSMFPYKEPVKKNKPENSWITKGILKPRNRMCFLNRLKQTNSLSSKSLHYIKNYQTIYRKVIKEAKRMEVEKLVASAINKTKTMWKLINNEMGNTKKLSDNIEIKHGSDLITNPPTYFR
jgi:hypothetical protein